MSPLHKQGRTKAEKRSVQMSAQHEETEQPRWECPPPAERVEDPRPLVVTPDGADPERDRVLIRFVHHTITDDLIRFAVVQQTYHRSRWRDVVEVDTCHDVDVHLHQYIRSTGARDGRPPEVLADVFRVEDVQDGYVLAYDRVIEGWDLNRRRWLDG